MFRFGNCVNCGCRYNSHKAKYNVEEIPNYLDDIEMNTLKSENDVRIELVIRVNRYKNEHVKLKNELEKLISINAKLNKFLEENSLAPFKDTFEVRLI